MFFQGVLSWLRTKRSLKGEATCLDLHWPMQEGPNSSGRPYPNSDLRQKERSSSQTSDLDLAPIFR